MKHSYLALIISFFCLSQLGGCGPKSFYNDSSAYQIPWWDASTQKHRLQTVEIPSFSEPQKLKGQYAQIYIHPSANNQEGLADRPAVGRFTKVGSESPVYVPLDYNSLQGATVYAHFERLYQLDRELGIAKLLHWPAKVAIEARIADNGGRSFLTDNALYSGDIDAFFVVPYVGDGLIITLNGGVLAHEHFHAIFHRLVQSRLRNKVSMACSWEKKVGSMPTLGDFNYLTLRGFNEGLADFWGWLYSDDLDFVARSIPSLKTERSLKTTASPLFDLNSWEAHVIRSSTVTRGGRRVLSMAAAYELGTEYARFLKDVVRLLVLEGVPYQQAKVQLAKAVLASLTDLTTHVQALEARASSGRVYNPAELMVSPHVLVDPIVRHLKFKDPKALCNYVQTFLLYYPSNQLPRRCLAGGV